MRLMHYIISAALAGIFGAAGLAWGGPTGLGGSGETGRLESQLDQANRLLAYREAELARLERERDRGREQARDLRRRQAALEAELCREREILIRLENDLAWRRQLTPADRWTLDQAAGVANQRRQELIAAETEAGEAAAILGDLRVRAADLVRQSDVDAAAAEAKRRGELVNTQVDRVLDALEQREDYRVLAAAQRDLAGRIFAELRGDPFDIDAAVRTFGLWFAATDRINTLRRTAVENDPQVIVLRKDADAAVDVQQALARRANDQAPLARSLTEAETQAVDAENRRAAAARVLQAAETDLWRMQEQMAARNADLGPLHIAILNHRRRADAIARDLDRAREAAECADRDDRRDHGPWQASRMRRDEARASVDDLNRQLKDAVARETAEQRRQREQQDRRRQEEMARAEAQRRAEAERQRQIEQERRDKAEAARVETARLKTAEEQRQWVRRQQETARKAEEARQAEQQRQEEARQADIARAEQARKADDQRRADEDRRQREQRDQQARAEAARRADEVKRAEAARAEQARAEQARAEQARAEQARAEQARRADDQRRADEDRRQREQRDQQARAEAARRADEAKRAEAARDEQARKADDQRRAEEDKRRREEQARLDAARVRTAEEQRQWVQRQQRERK